MPKIEKIKKVLVIGSGPILIGQGAEFDYAGTQALKVLKKEGINVLLINPNPATIMTDKTFADTIYFEPLTVSTVARIIKKEHPDGLLAGLGGQTGLTLATKLSEQGILDEFGVRLLGSSLDTIKKSEDRELFRKAMVNIGQPCVQSEIATDINSALCAARSIGYPVIVRPAYTLGGAGGGIALDEESFISIASEGLKLSPITQILVEKSIAGWKEIEFETMRDNAGNSVIVCSMENVDPVGIHTGDSIVVAPTLTLSEHDYQKLKLAALKIVSALGIVGACNCQFALNPETCEYAVIEVNPRVSRSSALASKASGYPIAKISTLITLGYNLDEIKNEVTGKSLANFEPVLNYIVVKFPKWPFDKFIEADRTLGTKMKSTGEVMAIGDTFIEALMKAVRGAQVRTDSLNLPPINNEDILTRLTQANDVRIFTIYEALKKGVPESKIFEITKIDPHFIRCLKDAALVEKELTTKPLGDELFLKAKKIGFTNSFIKKLTKKEFLPDFMYRYKAVDTCAEVFNCKSPYFYSSIADNNAGENKNCDISKYKSNKPVIIVLGSGPIRIGQGVEFDYSSVHCAWSLQKMGYDVVVINNNPETVSTDYETADRLYFEPLTAEDVLSVVKAENPVGVVVAFGGQTAINLTKELVDKGVAILGTSANSIDVAENRAKFDDFLEKLDIKRPKAISANSTYEALNAAETLGYPVLLRPSYVIGGQGMCIIRNDKDMHEFMSSVSLNFGFNSVLIDKYMPGIELDVDCISDGETVVIPAILEHIERAGIHSGDSIAVCPSFSLSNSTLKMIESTSVKIATQIGTRGLINIQYLLYENRLYVIEVNPRASRTVPYISKVTGIPMVDLATSAMLGKSLKDMGYSTGLRNTKSFYSVKIPVFSFEKLTTADPIMGPQMKSTGEVLGIGRTIAEALYKGFVSCGIDINDIKKKKKQGILISVEDYDYSDALKLAEKFTDLGIPIYATPDTSAALKEKGLEVTVVRNVWENNDINNLLDTGKVTYVVYTGAVLDSSVGDFRSLQHKAISFKIPCLTSIDTAFALADIISSCYCQGNTKLFSC